MEELFPKQDSTKKPAIIVKRILALLEAGELKPGDKLSAGDIVIVLEAMKMQSNYKVNSDCTVREVLVSEGDSVNSNQVLLTLSL